MNQLNIGAGRWVPAVCLVPLAFAFACEASSDGDDVGAGGSATIGGAASAGRASSNGGSSSAGTPAVPATGGSMSSGGSSTAGAAVGGSLTGGASGSSAGGAPAGGTSAGGAGMGGSPAGGAGAAGAFAGGAGKGGAPSAGASGGGGSAGMGGSQGMGTPGCASANPLKSGNFTETIDGASRKYVLDVPSAYDTNKKHRLIFVWHPLGGSASQVVSDGYNGLKSLSNGSAIFVAADGLNGSNAEASGNGWWNVNDRDMKFLTAMLDRLKAGLCIDEDRIFSTGFSFGGMMSYTVGYQFDVFRAIAPCSGDLQVIPHEDNYTEPLPIMAFHGNNDTFVTTARGRAARDKYLARNQCGTQTQPVSPSPCVQYQGCSVPTIWCEFPGGHNTWAQQPQAIWTFFSQF